MKQFCETYSPLPKLATLLRVLSWSKHLLLLSHCKSEEEKEFYLLSATRGRWSHRELERQIKKSAFERTMLSDLKLATVSQVLPENAAGVFMASTCPLMRRARETILALLLVVCDKSSSADKIDPYTIRFYPDNAESSSISSAY
jgi:hypothetical protein